MINVASLSVNGTMTVAIQMYGRLGVLMRQYTHSILLMLTCVSLTGTVSSTAPDPLTDMYAVPKLSDTPTLAQLQSLKGTEGKVLMIIDHVAHKWGDIGINMDFDATGYTVRTIKANNHDVTDCCKVMFTTWLEGKGSKQPPTWNVLIQILDDCNLKVLASDVRKALS